MSKSFGHSTLNTQTLVHSLRGNPIFKIVHFIFNLFSLCHQYSEFFFSFFWMKKFFSVDKRQKRRHKVKSRKKSEIGQKNLFLPAGSTQQLVEIDNTLHIFLNLGGTITFENRFGIAVQVAQLSKNASIIDGKTQAHAEKHLGVVTA